MAKIKIVAVPLDAEEFDLGDGWEPVSMSAMDSPLGPRVIVLAAEAPTPYALNPETNTQA